MKKIKSNRSKAVETAAGLTSLPLSSNDISTVGVALEMHSARNSVSGALGASVPTESMDGQSTPCGNKRHKKEKKTMAKKASQGGQSPHKNAARRLTSKRAGGAGASIVSAAVAKHSQVICHYKGGLNDNPLAYFDAIFAKSLLEKIDNRFFCKSKGEDDAAEREFVCEDEIQRLQVKLAAYRCILNRPDDDVASAMSSLPSTMFGTLRSLLDGSTIGIKVTFVLNESVPAEIEATAILRKLGVPSGFELVQYSNSEVYALIEELFVLHDVDRSQYESVFGSSDMPSICSDMCESVYEAIGDITFPPMTLSEFGNVLHCLKFFGEEVALATLRRIYSDRCQA
jgi:hypothetical protein